ncbi:MAG: hypothetical protein IJN39_07515, partial [Clostridia bacterium]|nr:hypothetical protein [Clostridia bacterium]
CDYIIITDDPSFSPNSISDLKAFKTENLYSDEKVKYPESVRPDTEFALSVNGNYLEPENEMYLIDEALMLPCSEVMELLGFSPVFNSENASVVIPKSGYAIEAVAGSDAMLYRGSYSLMSRKAEMKNGVLYVPVDFFAVALNGAASYDTASKTAKILYDEKDASLYIGVDNFLLSPGTWYKDSDDTLRSSSVNSTTAVSANASFKIDVPGTYTLFIKSFDSTTTIANRRFHAILDGNTLETALGQHGTEGHAWTKVGSYNLEKGNHTLGLYNTSGSPHARFSGAFLTLDESHALPETDEEIANFKVPDSSLELAENASYPVWATLDGTALAETSIENDHVKLSFITEAIGDETVIKSEFYLKTADGLKVMKTKNENNGFLMLRADQSTANGRSSAFEAKNTQTINGVTGNVENYYKQGAPTWFIPSGITKVSDSEVKLSFNEGDATLTATYKLDTLTSDPKVTLDASFSKGGAYSFVLSNGNSVSENSFDTVTAPFFYVKSEAPKTAGVLPESYLFTPMA